MKVIRTPSWLSFEREVHALHPPPLLVWMWTWWLELGQQLHVEDDTATRRVQVADTVEPPFHLIPLTLGLCLYNL